MKPGFLHSNISILCKVWLLAKASIAAHAQKLRKVTAAAVKADAIMAEAASSSLSEELSTFGTPFTVLEPMLKWSLRSLRGCTALLLPAPLSGFAVLVAR